VQEITHQAANRPTVSVSSFISIFQRGAVGSQFSRGKHLAS